MAINPYPATDDAGKGGFRSKARHCGALQALSRFAADACFGIIRQMLEGIRSRVYEFVAGEISRTNERDGRVGSAGRPPRLA